MSKKQEDVQPEEAKDPTPLDIFLDHQKNAVKETGKALQALIPKTFSDHSQSAIKESLEGYRKLFNAAMDDVVEMMEKAKFKDDEK